ncbi:uncharacterized protein BXZ73DRAFT_82760 [Epithele typhae]|uniref:uncharacterized protein n=1 Tax=Epithele typhae TaxID=378194 RepID=UPI0020080F2F|nr:uncharacterized protein BXZ73DRAFT_82760 [Epithele typhae]KAH9911466.1 hypothetical protein BXZ73DRAFT_82760 [Epithele typhae]
MTSKNTVPPLFSEMLDVPAGAAPMLANTFAAGVTPSYPGTPAFPTAYSAQVKERMKELNGLDIPDLDPTLSGATRKEHPAASLDVGRTADRHTGYNGLSVHTQWGLKGAGDVGETWATQITQARRRIKWAAVVKPDETVNMCEGDAGDDEAAGSAPSDRGRQLWRRAGGSGPRAAALGAHDFRSNTEDRDGYDLLSRLRGSGRGGSQPARPDVRVFAAWQSDLSNAHAVAERCVARLAARPPRKGVFVLLRVAPDARGPVWPRQESAWRTGQGRASKGDAGVTRTVGAKGAMCGMGG